MLRKASHLSLLVAGTLHLGACSEMIFQPDPSGSKERQVHLGGAFVMPSINAVSLIESFSEPASDKQTVACNTAKYQLGKVKAKWGEDSVDALLSAYALFEKCGLRPEENSTQLLSKRRNQIQDAMLSAAERRCQLYKTLLTKSDSSTQFVSGGLVTVLSGLSALVGGSAGQYLAGSAGAIAGINAEFNAAYFKDTVVKVIISGLDTKQLGIHTEIATRQNGSIDQYSLANAMKDAMRYNGACNINEGVKEAQERLARNGQIGIEQAAVILRQTRELERERRISATPDPTERATLIRAIAEERKAEAELDKVASASPGGTLVKPAAQAPQAVVVAEEAKEAVNAVESAKTVKASADARLIKIDAELKELEKVAKDQAAIDAKKKEREAAAKSQDEATNQLAAATAEEAAAKARRDTFVALQAAVIGLYDTKALTPLQTPDTAAAAVPYVRQVASAMGAPLTQEELDDVAKGGALFKTRALGLATSLRYAREDVLLLLQAVLK